MQTSEYSKLAGVPVALIGLIGYIAILGSLLAPENETSTVRDGRRCTLGGFGFSAYLTYRELFSIHEICEWCVSSAVIMTMLDVPGDLALPARRRSPARGRLAVGRAGAARCTGPTAPLGAARS